MAREVKPVQLRTVDEDAADATPVVRLENRETEWHDREVKPIRLGPTVEDSATSRRLDLPDKEEVELRTHQPGIDVLIESETANLDLLEENWGEATLRRNPVPWGWFALIGLAIAGALVWSLTRVEKADVQAAKIRVETQSALVSEEREEREARQLIDRIDKTIRSYFRATTVESLAGLVRHRERVVPLMRDYYGTQSVPPVLLKSVKMLQPLTLDNRGNFWMASVVLADQTTRNLVIEIAKSGEPRIDWETLVCYQPMKWDDFVTKRPTGTSLDFRVYADQDNFHSHEFANSDQWVSFRLTALDSEETVFGYARADSPAAESLLTQVRQNGGRRASVILRLSIPEGLQSRRGVVIEKLLNTRWLYLDPPATGS